jgi:hypothetical protein
VASGANAQSTSPQASAAVLAAAAFAGAPTGGGAAQLLGEQTFERGAGPAAYRSGQMSYAGHDGSVVDSLRFSSVQPLVAPSGLPLVPGQASDSQAYALSLERTWPRALSFETRDFGVAFSPHAAVGVTSYGSVAEAGGRIELSQKLGEIAKERLEALGVRDGRAFGDTGRWYLFAAASGRAVGLNMLRGETGWNRAGWTTDATSTLVGDAQVGVGWRKGAMQTSLGFVHQTLKNNHLLYGEDSPSESMVAFSFTVRPQPR